ncbi:MAG: hypothetical protein IJJ29_09310 [Solobacterium sp.]|nr:hypothetical protein [Solobacterium sp.]
MFRRTGLIVIAVSAVASLLFPFFAESPMDYLQTAGVFMLLALPYGISYFLMGPNFVIMADQKEYRINIWIQSISILRMVLMITAILLKMPFLTILLIEGANILCANFTARRIALNAYPWLKDTGEKDNRFASKARYAVIQRLSELATTQTDNIVVTGFMGYAMSSVYGTYSYLSDNIGKITQTMVQSPMNSFGNLFNSDKVRSFSVFTEFFNFSTFVSTIVACEIFIVMPQFVPMWMRNPLYQTSLPICFFLACNIFYMTSRQPVMIARDTNGLYVNAKNNAYLLAAVKIILSVILVSRFGLLGAAMATTFAYWTVDLSYNPGLVYREVFGLPVSRYYRMFLLRFAIALVLGGAGWFCWQRFIPYVSSSLIHFVISALILGIALSVSAFAVYTIMFASFRSLLQRLMSVLRR